MAIDWSRGPIGPGWFLLFAKEKLPVDDGGDVVKPKDLKRLEPDKLSSEVLGLMMLLGHR